MNISQTDNVSESPLPPVTCLPIHRVWRSRTAAKLSADLPSPCLSVAKLLLSCRRLIFIVWSVASLLLKPIFTVCGEAALLFRKNFWIFGAGRCVGGRGSTEFQKWGGQFLDVVSFSVSSCLIAS